MVTEPVFTGETAPTLSSKLDPSKSTKKSGSNKPAPLELPELNVTLPVKFVFVLFKLSLIVNVKLVASPDCSLALLGLIAIREMVPAVTVIPL